MLAIIASKITSQLSITSSIVPFLTGKPQPQPLSVHHRRHSPPEPFPAVSKSLSEQQTHEPETWKSVEDREEMTEEQLMLVAGGQPTLFSSKSLDQPSPQPAASRHWHSHQISHNNTFSELVAHSNRLPPSGSCDSHNPHPPFGSRNIIHNNMVRQVPEVHGRQLKDFTGYNFLYEDRQCDVGDDAIDDFTPYSSFQQG